MYNRKCLEIYERHFNILGYSQKLTCGWAEHVMFAKESPIETQIQFFFNLAIQTGDLGRILSGQANPFSMWTGLPGMSLPGFSSASMLSAAAKMSSPYSQVNTKQLSNLWGSEKLSTSPLSMMNPGSLGNFGFNGVYGTPKAEVEDDEVAADDEEDMGVIETYSNYWPMKLTVSKPYLPTFTAFLFNLFNFSGQVNK